MVGHFKCPIHKLISNKKILLNIYLINNANTNEINFQTFN